jgi:excisionase family DNA binding protein
MEAFLTSKQVEELFNVDRTTIYRMLKDGRLVGVKIGKHWRFALQEVEELMSGNINRRSEDQSEMTEALPVHCMQPIQDVFAEIAQVGSVTTDKDGTPITKISNACDFCKLILGSEDGRQACYLSWKRLVSQKENAPEFTICHAGLKYARARIEINNELIAILVSGQFYLETPDPEEEDNRLQLLSSKYHIDYDILKLAAKKITVLESRNIPQISGWLEKVAKTFEQISSERADLMTRLKQISKMSEI